MICRSKALAAFIILGAASVLFASEPARQTLAGPLDPLPPAAQELLNKGIQAAKDEDFAGALSLFMAARDVAPESALLSLNMGLAESKLPGRELRALTWLGAYLVAVPDAANVAMKQQIEALKKQNRQTLARFTGAVAEAAQFASSGHARAQAQGDHAVALVGIGDIAGAQTMAGKISPGFSKSRALQAIAQALAAGADKPSARAALIEAASAAQKGNNYWETITMLESIAATQLQLGDIEHALQSTTASEKIIEQWGNAEEQTKAWTHLANARIKAWHAASARSALVAAERSASGIMDAYWKTQTFAGIGAAQAANGDFAAALKTAAGLEDWFARASIAIAVAEAQARSGDLNSAKATAGRITDVMKGRALRGIAQVQIENGEMAGAQATLLDAGRAEEKGHNRPLDKCIGLAGVAELQARAGDLVGAHSSLLSAQKAGSRIPANKAQGLSGENSDRRMGQASWAKAAAVIDHIERPVEEWRARILYGPLANTLFTHLPVYAKSLRDNFPDPDQYLNALNETTTKLIEERDMTEAMLEKIK